jgi:hypothetical protein
MEEAVDGSESNFGAEGWMVWMKERCIDGTTDIGVIDKIEGET